MSIFWGGHLVYDKNESQHTVLIMCRFNRPVDEIQGIKKPIKILSIRPIILTPH